MNLADFISDNAARHASKHKILAGERSISFAELDAMIDAVAARLIAHGARAGEPVGLSLQDHPLHLAALFAVLRIGAIVLPMDWRWTPAEQLKIAKKFRPRVVLSEPNRPAAPGVDAVAVDRGWERASEAFKNRVNDAANFPAMLGLSSGTTGEPKAVVTTHAQYHARIVSFTNACGLRSDDVYCSTLPLVFSAGRLFALANLVNGATVALIPTLSAPAEVADAINAMNATTTCLVPSVTRQLLKLSADGRVRFPRLRVLMSIGAPMHDADRTAIRRRLAPNLIDIYASTGGGLASVISAAEMDAHAGSVGRAAQNVEFQVVDESDQPLPTGSIGRVRYRGPGFPLGFYGGVAAGDEDIRDDWFYPGDFAAIDADGYIHLQGRRSEIVIRGGINVFTPEVERALLTHAKITEAAVVGMPSDQAGEDLVAFIVSSSPLEVRDIMQHCRTRLAAYKIPGQFHFVNALPQNAAGKILKNELAKRAAAAPKS